MHAAVRGDGFGFVADADSSSGPRAAASSEFSPPIRGLVFGRGIIDSHEYARPNAWLPDSSVAVSSALVRPSRPSNLYHAPCLGRKVWRKGDAVSRHTTRSGDGTDQATEPYLPVTKPLHRNGPGAGTSWLVKREFDLVVCTLAGSQLLSAVTGAPEVRSRSRRFAYKPPRHICRPPATGGHVKSTFPLSDFSPDPFAGCRPESRAPVS
jgi:hypothetical protein